MKQQVVGILFALVAISNAAVKVPVTIYYESLCPDSAALITEKIHPVLQDELKEHVDITWVPFGKSEMYTQGADVEFTCHHGPNECYGNKVHACAINIIQANSYQAEFTRESLTLDFITCLMKVGKNFPDNVYPGAKCARENHINTWANIETCANSTEGSKLLQEQGKMTNAFQKPLTSVPTVVFKHVFDNDVQQMALKDFKTTLCGYIMEPKPKTCMPVNSAAGLSFIPFLGAALYAVSRLV
ncbi:GILT-like protein 1 [Episyrphus balteatus]|uniref:GILT-like protein 1 n=1 Tax=Episyrphus balteatus TaxID=286459 RepID=UPI002486B3D7|nr:GILT-like protein 1 [Episyrphus balteatus]